MPDACDNCKNSVTKICVNRTNLDKCFALQPFDDNKLELRCQNGQWNVLRENTSESWTVSAQPVCSGSSHLSMELCRTSSPTVSITFSPGTIDSDKKINGDWNSSDSGTENGTWSATQTTPTEGHNGDREAKVDW